MTRPSRLAGEAKMASEASPSREGYTPVESADGVTSETNRELSKMVQQVHDAPTY